VEDRHLEAFGDVRRVVRGAAGVRGRREADLVVDDDVDGAAGAVGGQLAHVEGLVDHALAGEGGVPVDEDREHGAAVVVLSLEVLPGADDAFEHAVGGLQVGGVGRQVDARRLAGGRGVDALRPQVVFDVSGAVDAPRIDQPVELGEDLPVRLAGDVRQDVQPAAMRHGDGHRVAAVARGPRPPRAPVLPAA